MLLLAQEPVGAHEAGVAGQGAEVCPGTFSQHWSGPEPGWPWVPRDEHELCLPSGARVRVGKTETDQQTT